MHVMPSHVLDINELVCALNIVMVIQWKLTSECINAVVGNQHSSQHTFNCQVGLFLVFTPINPGGKVEHLIEQIYFFIVKVTTS